MKHFFTLFLLLPAFSLTAQFGQIPNGDFESWGDDTLYVAPDIWNTSNAYQFLGYPTVSQSSDAQDGNYSVELQSVLIGQDTLAGYVYHGDMLSYAGIPYSGTFEAVTFQYKADLPPGDTLFMYLIRYNGGNIVDFDVIPAVYGTTASWTPNLLYVGNELCNELFIAFSLENPTLGPSTPGAWARVDNVQFLAGSTVLPPLPNNSFEDWVPQTVENPGDWYSINWFLGNFGLENVTKTTDAYAGNYAVQMNTIYAAPDTITALLSLAPIELFTGTPFQTAPYNGTPTLFAGAYKYSASNGDQAGISIAFYENGSVVGSHFELFSDQPTYTPFVSPVTISGNPDSIAFIVFSGDNPGSELKLDNLQFSEGGIGILENNLPEFSVYPNPASDEVWVALSSDASCSIELVSMNGQGIMHISDASGKVRIPLEDVPKGVYSVVIRDTYSQRIQKLVID